MNWCCLFSIRSAYCISGLIHPQQNNQNTKHTRMGRCPLLTRKGQWLRKMWRSYPITELLNGLMFMFLKPLTKHINNNLWLEKSPQVNLSLLLHLRKQNNNEKKLTILVMFGNFASSYQLLSSCLHPKFDSFPLVISRSKLWSINC